MCSSGCGTGLNQVAKYMISSTLDDPGWENTKVRRGDVRDEVRALNEMPGDQDVVVTGGMQLVPAWCR